MRILGIESSCDETAAAVVEDGRRVLSNVISSQIAIHTEYGGVVPEIASRKHIENIDPVIKQALIEAEQNSSLLRDAAHQGVARSCSSFDGIDAIAVTYGPGLVGALLVGVAEAKALAYALNKPLIAVNHIKGHIAANYLEHPDLEPPYLCLVVSGGHTNLVAIKSYTDYEIIGRTRDDAAGEAFDKVARSVGLGYPGGPKIDKEAKNGNPDAIKFPQAKVEGAPYDFSFSGIKSAVLNYQNHAEMMREEINRADLVASFQKAVVGVLVDHTVMAMKEFGYNTVALAGGVASNSALREAMKQAVPNVIYPSPIYCTDNAAMIAGAGYYEFLNGNRAKLDLNAVPGLKF